MLTRCRCWWWRLTCDGDKRAVLSCASFSDHTQRVEAFVFLVEVRKSQGGDSSASFNLYPFRVKQASV